MVVELANSRKDISALAAEMDLRPELIYRWRREALANLGASLPGQDNKTMTEEQKEIARLKKELRDAQLERDILKKAVSIFSRSDGKYSNLIKLPASRYTRSPVPGNALAATLRSEEVTRWIISEMTVLQRIKSSVI